MSRGPCPKCAQVKAEAMAQLGLINNWQAHALDLETALRNLVDAMADFEKHPQGRSYDLSDNARRAFKAARAALGDCAADHAQTAAIAEALNR